MKYRNISSQTTFIAPYIRIAPILECCICNVFPYFSCILFDKCIFKGLASDAVQNKKRSEAWAAVLGIGVAVCFVAMVVYVILRRRGQRDFTHRKLVEEIPSDPGRKFPWRYFPFRISWHIFYLIGLEQ